MYFDLSRRADQLEDEHVLGHPAFVARLHRGDAQGVALLSEQGVSAVAGTIRPDLTRLRKMADILVRGVAGPGGILLVRAQRSADGMQSADELTVVAKDVQHLCAKPSHQVHVGDDVRRVADFNSNLGHRRTNRTHAVGNHVHRAPGH